LGGSGRGFRIEPATDKLNTTRRICGARTRSGDRCHLEALSGKTRCRQHGAAGGRPPGIPEHPNSCAARLEGRRRWVERLRAAKARGEIERFPGGRRARGLPPLSREPTIRRAQRLLEAEVAKKKVAGDGAVPRVWETLSKAAKLSHNADLALDCARQILELGVDPSDPKLLSIVKETALSVIAAQIRLDELRMNDPGDQPGNIAPEERRRWAVEENEEAFRERPREEAPAC